MAKGKYYIYICEQCKYEFEKLQEDIIVPVICPRCGGNVKMVKACINFSFIDKIIEWIHNIIKK